MSDDKPREGLKSLLSPPSTGRLLALLAGGALLGLVAVVAFEGVMHATSTDEFCVSCHEMDSPYAQLQKTKHFNNAMGIQATCSDCHLPQEFVPKMIRKVEAAREVWGTLTGIIDTPEKYAAHATAMKQREIDRLLANDSQECRNCHQEQRMLTAMQSAKAQQYHQNLETNDKTCISCHVGIAHPEYADGLQTAMD